MRLEWLEKGRSQFEALTVMMKIKMNILDKFELSDGSTVLACSGASSAATLVGKRVTLTTSEQARQTLVISSERRMLNQDSNIALKALETNDPIALSLKEARSGDWQLVMSNDENRAI